jgi:hypothetical protein
MLYKDLTATSARRMRVLGVAFAAIAAGLIGIWLGLDGASRSTSLPYLLSMFPTFAVLGALFFWVAGGPDRYRRFLARGVRGKATITDLILSGTRVNDIPVLELKLEVSVPGRPPYPASDKVLAYPGTVPNAGTFECVVDPQKPEAVKVLLDRPVLPEGVVAENAGSVGSYSTDQPVSNASGVVGGVQRAAELLRTGRPGRASIVQTFPTGMRLENGDQLLGFVLDVTPREGGNSWRATMAHRVPDSALGRAVAGSSVRVAYDPADPMRKVAIDWSGS